MPQATKSESDYSEATEPFFNMTAGDGTSDFDQLGKQLELQEIESPGGIATAQVYGQLMAINLLKNDLANAKFIWKRIPLQVKSANPDLVLIWEVGQKMWQREFPAIYEALQKDWSDSVKPIMNAIGETTRRRAFSLVSQAYSSISGDDFAAFMGMSVQDAVDAAVAQGWTADPQARMITPKPQEKSPDAIIPSEQQLARLTEFVSFLEN